MASSEDFVLRLYVAGQTPRCMRDDGFGITPELLPHVF